MCSVLDLNSEPRPDLFYFIVQFPLFIADSLRCRGARELIMFLLSFRQVVDGVLRPPYGDLQTVLQRVDAPVGRTATLVAMHGRALHRSKGVGDGH